MCQTDSEGIPILSELGVIAPCQRLQIFSMEARGGFRLARVLFDSAFLHTGSRTAQENMPILLKNTPKTATSFVKIVRRRGKG